MHALLLTLALATAPETMRVTWLGLELSQAAGGEISVAKVIAPAAPSVAVGDRLVAVLSGDHPGKLAGVTLCELWPMLVGPIGEPISLRLVRNGKPFEVELKRTDPPGTEAQAKAAVPKGVPPETARQMIDAQRNMLRAMALQAPAMCGTWTAPLNSEAVTAFTTKAEKVKNPCDLRWIKAQPEVDSWQVSPTGDLSVFLKGGGPAVVMDCGHGE